MFMCIYTCYMTDITKTSGLHRCVCVYVHVIGLTRQRNDGYIWYVCVYIHVIGLIKQRDDGYMCMCLCTC